MSEQEKFTFILNKYEYPVYLPQNISMEEVQKIEIDLKERIEQISEKYHYTNRENLLSICLIEAVLLNKMMEKEQTQYKSSLNKDLHDLLETLNQQNI